MLKRCLDSLKAQGDGGGRFSWFAIIVDNNATPSMIESELELHLVHEPRLGIPFARNKALDAALSAGADLIVFIDDDEVAPPGWLAGLVDCLQTSGADVVQGGVCQTTCPEQLSRPKPVDKFASTRAAETAATCNTIMRAWIAQPPHALRFDENMRFTGGSDLEYFMRAHQRGAKIVRAKGLDVIEHLCPERQTLRYRAMRSFSSGNNYFTRIAKNCGFMTATRRIFFRALNRLVTGCANGALASVLAVISPSASHRMLRKALVNICFAAGCISPAFGLRRQPYLTVMGL